MTRTERVSLILASIVSLMVVLGFLWNLAGNTTKVLIAVEANTKVLEARKSWFDAVERKQEKLVADVALLKEAALTLVYIGETYILVKDANGDTHKVPIVKEGKHVKIPEDFNLKHLNTS